MICQQRQLRRRWKNLAEGSVFRVGRVVKRVADRDSSMGEMLVVYLASAMGLDLEDKQASVYLELVEDMLPMYLCSRDSARVLAEPWKESDDCVWIEAKLWQPLLSN